MKVLHFTHIDGDALGCVIAANCIKGYNPDDFSNYFISASKSDEVILRTLLDIKEGEIYGLEELELILITDISIKEETANAIDNFVKSREIDALLIDHHESNKSNEYVNWAYVYPGFYELDPVSQDSITFNSYSLIETNGKDGKATLSSRKYSAAWNILFNDDIRKVLPLKQSLDFGNLEVNIIEVITKMINDISDYDTWAWKEVPGLEKDQDRFAIFIKTRGWIGDATDDCVKSMFYGIHPTEMPVGADYLIASYQKKQEICITRKMNKVAYIRWYEYNVGIILCDDDFINAELEAIYTNDQSIDISVALFPETRTIGFRTCKPDINVQRIASRIFSGGGHKNAAGGKLSAEEMSTWLVQYYQAIDRREALNMHDEGEK